MKIEVHFRNHNLYEYSPYRRVAGKTYQPVKGIIHVYVDSRLHHSLLITFPHESLHAVTYFLFWGISPKFSRGLNQVYEMVWFYLQLKIPKLRITPNR